MRWVFFPTDQIPEDSKKVRTTKHTRKIYDSEKRNKVSQPQTEVHNENCSIPKHNFRTQIAPADNLEPQSRAPEGSRSEPSLRSSSPSLSMTRRVHSRLLRRTQMCTQTREAPLAYLTFSARGHPLPRCFLQEGGDDYRTAGLSIFLVFLLCECGFFFEIDCAVLRYAYEENGLSNCERGCCCFPFCDS